MQIKFTCYSQLHRPLFLFFSMYTGTTQSKVNSSNIYVSFFAVVCDVEGITFSITQTSWQKRQISTQETWLICHRVTLVHRNW